MGTQATAVFLTTIRRPSPLEERRSREWNRGCSVRFLLNDEHEFERQLVDEIVDPATELNVASPVGAALLTACVGDRLEVKAPGGYVVVKVLEIRRV
jgi:transcription elongation GreA/GreB family factor